MDARCFAASATRPFSTQSSGIRGRASPAGALSGWFSSNSVLVCP